MGNNDVEAAERTATERTAVEDDERDDERNEDKRDEERDDEEHDEESDDEQHDEDEPDDEERASAAQRKRRATNINADDRSTMSHEIRSAVLQVENNMMREHHAKLERIRRQHQLAVKSEQLATTIGDVRVKDAQLAMKDEQLAGAQTQLADKDEHHRQERMHWYNRFDGHLTNLLDTHQRTMLQAQNTTREHITRQLIGMESRLTLQPNNALKHEEIAVLLTDNNDGTFEHRLICGGSHYPIGSLLRHCYLENREERYR